MADCAKFRTGRCTNSCKVCKIMPDGVPNGMKEEDYPDE